MSKYCDRSQEESLAEQNYQLREENKRLEAWIDDLQSGMYINCVYCGHRYGPDDKDHIVTMRKALEAHIAECPKHPLSLAVKEIAVLKNRIEILDDKDGLSYADTI